MPNELQFEERDAAFAEFLRTWKPDNLGLAQQAFNAGWAARKHAEYRRTMTPERAS